MGFFLSSLLSFFPFLIQAARHIMRMLTFLVRVLESAQQRTNEFLIHGGPRKLVLMQAFVRLRAQTASTLCRTTMGTSPIQTKAKTDRFLSVSQENDGLYEIDILVPYLQVQHELLWSIQWEYFNLYFSSFYILICYVQNSVCQFSASFCFLSTEMYVLNYVITQDHVLSHYSKHNKVMKRGTIQILFQCCSGPTDQNLILSSGPQ